MNTQVSLTIQSFKQPDPSLQHSERKSAFCAHSFYERRIGSCLDAPGGSCKPHHITQRGTGRQRVFYSHRDRRVYLEQLRINTTAEGVLVLAYSLMTNHIHLIVVPPGEESLATAIRRTHGRYAQYLNARKLRTGHLWQDRFFSCPLEDKHLWAALRYVERASAADWEWSSARAHLGLTTTFGCLDRDFWQEAGGAPRWQSLLAEPEPEEWLKGFRRATYAGNPFGSEAFIECARQTRNTTETPPTPTAWGRESGPPCHEFSGKGVL
ncbi:MAG: transposase [Candidatus Hydrogenedentes bacterium]|nr:transposase [Candidatus Hydrogenedentota bacterium]